MDVSIFNEAEALERVSGNRKMLRDMAAMAYQYFEKTLPLIMNLDSSGDREEVAQMVHKLKSAYGNLSAKIVVQRLQSLELTLQHDSETEIIQSHAKELEKAVLQFEDLFRESGV
jgi:HPt (histidine-containing phosphotransfer) domain-containing protein